MKKNVFIGVLLVAFSIIYPFTPEGTSVSVNLDLLPDFLGFIFIFMGLDKLQYYNKRMRDVSAFAVFFAVVSFITFISQLYPFYLSSLIQTNEYGVQLNPLYFLG